MKKTIFLTAAAAMLLLASCASYTRGELYPKFYEETPVSLLVMPPINNTTNVEAKDHLYTSISQPLVEAGYYVISPHLALEMLKAESAYDAELFVDRDAAIFARVFGADAVIFSVIDEWRKVGVGIQTKIRYIVKSTKTNQVLFDRTCNLFLNLETEVSDSKNKSLFETLLDVTATLVNTALTDHIVAARKCNRYIFSDIPRGKYSPDFMNDQEKAASEPNAHVTVK
jgi:hypothetical protein